jgi:hypothetical protein
MPIKKTKEDYIEEAKKFIIKKFIIINMIIHK